ncbi:MAG: hypothetical protein ABR512_16425, partial [Desulfopila sp.]
VTPEADPESRPTASEASGKNDNSTLPQCSHCERSAAIQASRKQSEREKHQPATAQQHPQRCKTDTILSVL